MDRIRRSILLFVLFLPPVLLAAGMGFLLSDAGLNGVVRPRLERFLGERLEGEVRLGRLALDARRLEVTGLQMEGAGGVLCEIARLEVGFTLARLLRGRLDLLRVEGLDARIVAEGGEGGAPARPPFSVERVEVAGGRLILVAAGREWQAEDLAFEGRLDDVSPFRLAARFGAGAGIFAQMQGRVAWEDGPSLVLETLRWDGQDLLASPLTLTFPHGGIAAGGAIVVERFDDAQLGRMLEVFALPSPLPAKGGFALEDVHLGFSLEGEGIHGTATARRARVTLAGREMEIRDVTLQGEESGGTWRGEGSLLLFGEGVLRVTAEGAEGGVRGTFALQGADPAALLRAATGKEGPVMAGRLDLQGEFSAASDGFDVAARVRGVPGGEGEWDISLLRADVQGAYREGDLSVEGRLFQREREIARFRGNGETFRAEVGPIDGAELALLLPSAFRPAALDGARGVTVAATARPVGRGWSGEATLRAARLDLAPAVLEEVRFEGSFALGDEKMALRPAAFSARLGGEGIPSARLSARGAGEAAGEDFRLTLESWGVEGVEYISPDGLTGMTGGSARGRGEFSGRFGGDIHLRLAADVQAGEVLRDAFYADLSGLPGKVGLEGVYDPAARRLRVRRLAVDLDGVGGVALSGEIDPDVVACAGSGAFPDLKAGFERLQLALGENILLLRETALSGALSVEAALRRDGAGWRLKGVLEPRQISLRQGQAHLAGLSGLFPFDLGTGPAAAEERSGALSLDQLSWGPAQLRTRSLRLHSAPGRFALDDALVFALAAGEVEIAAPSADLSAREPALMASVAVRGVDLGLLTRELGTIEMAGRVSADLGRIHYKGGTLTTAGGMTIEVFGGRILVRNLRFDALLTPYPTYTLDADFTGIDLRELTRTFAVGEVNGIADGFVHDLRLFGAVPSRFEAALVTRLEGRRNISVKALRNLSTVSQGGISAALSRGIYRFIDFYHYRRIGLYCTLMNDVFVLQGTARAGGRHLVDGGLLPPWIDVIAPEHAISFREMVKRLQRIERTDASGKN